MQVHMLCVVNTVVCNEVFGYKENGNSSSRCCAGERLVCFLIVTLLVIFKACIVSRSCKLMIDCSGGTLAHSSPTNSCFVPDCCFAVHVQDSDHREDAAS